MTIRGGQVAGVPCTLLWLAVLAVPCAAAPLASALGPEVALAEPENGFVGVMNVVPENGPAGTPLALTAERLPPNQEFQLVWRTVKGFLGVPIPPADRRPIGR